MGRDGAAGLLEMRQAGARTLGQDEARCVVYGMPRVAFEIGAVERQLPLSRLSVRHSRPVRGAPPPRCTSPPEDRSMPAASAIHILIVDDQRRCAP